MINSNPHGYHNYSYIWKKSLWERVKTSKVYSTTENTALLQLKYNGEKCFKMEWKAKWSKLVRTRPGRQPPKERNVKNSEVFLKDWEVQAPHWTSKPWRLAQEDEPTLPDLKMSGTYDLEIWISVENQNFTCKDHEQTYSKSHHRDRLKSSWHSSQSRMTSPYDPSLASAAISPKRREPEAQPGKSYFQF